MNPILAVSLPGSSADFMQFLIEGSTGVLTSTGSPRNDAIAVKTHHPYYKNHVNVEYLTKSAVDQSDTQNESEKTIPRALLHLRDPLDSIESWMDWVKNSLQKTDETYRASAEDWVNWRENHFKNEIRQWEIFLRYWLDAIPMDSRFLVIHEKIMEEASGTTELIAIVQFMRKVADIPSYISIQSMPCLWYLITNDNVSGKVMDDRPYTFEDLDETAGILTRLIDDYSSEKKLASTLMNYKERVVEKMRQLKQQDPVMISNTMGKCMATTPVFREMTPVFLTSYPGSGSGMLRDLTEAITGIKTAESKRRNDVIAIKTAYPVNKKDIFPGFWNRDMKRAILLIRNPFQAIYSYHNHIYWREKNLSQHTMQAPKEAWEEWRDKHFLKELDMWINHLVYWMNKFDSKSRMVIRYEWLLDDQRGPAEGTRLAMFLEGTNNEEITPAPSLTVPCLWFRSVKVNDPMLTNTYHPSLTRKQLEVSAAKLSAVHRQYLYDLMVGPVLKSYWEEAIMQVPNENVNID